MNEELLEKYLDKVDGMTDEATTVIEKTSLAQVKIQARIARQLTIANEYRESELTVGKAIAEALEKIANPLIQVGKDGVMRSVPTPNDDFIEIPDGRGNTHCFHRHDLESYRDNYFYYSPQGGFSTPLSAKEIKAIAKPNTPLSPDALVNICRDTIARLGVLADIPQGDRLHKDNIDYIKGTREDLINALAAHEKAVE